MDTHGNDPGAARGDIVLGVSIATLVLAACFTVTRIVTRLAIVRDFGPEDWMIVVSTLLSIALTVMMAEQVDHGLGSHFYTLSTEEFVQTLYPFWNSVWIYNLTLCLTKISILLQYRRLLLFPRTQTAISITLAFVIVAGLASFFDSIFLCYPVQKFWDSMIDGKCANQDAVWYSNSSINIVLDLWIVVLPMRAIKRLELPRKQQITVIALFALGGFVCVTSIIRLYSLRSIANSTDPTYDNVAAAAWSCVETNCGIICACLPALWPLYVRIRGRTQTHPYVIDTLRVDSFTEGSRDPHSDHQEDGRFRSGDVVDSDDDERHGRRVTGADGKQIMVQSWSFAPSRAVSGDNNNRSTPMPPISPTRPLS